MRQGALLVNAARGPIVDTEALVEALLAGRIRAALDVTDPEPLPEGHPLWSCPNLLLTPHIGAASPQCTPNALRVAAEELRRYMRGEPLRNVMQAGAAAALRPVKGIPVRPAPKRWRLAEKLHAATGARRQSRKPSAASATKPA